MEWVLLGWGVATGRSWWWDQGWRGCNTVHGARECPGWSRTVKTDFGCLVQWTLTVSMQQLPRPEYGPLSDRPVAAFWLLSLWGLVPSIWEFTYIELYNIVAIYVLSSLDFSDGQMDTVLCVVSTYTLQTEHHLTACTAWKKNHSVHLEKEAWVGQERRRWDLLSDGPNSPGGWVTRLTMETDLRDSQEVKLTDVGSCCLVLADVVPGFILWYLHFPGSVAAP